MLRVNSAGQGIPICFVDIPVNLFTKKVITSYDLAMLPSWIRVKH